MRYLKTFENFSGVDDWKSVIENSEHFADVMELVENDPDINMLFKDLVSDLISVDIKQIEPLFYDFQLSSELLSEEFKKYKTTYKLGSQMTSESMQKIDVRTMAQHAIVYILGLGIMAGLVKLFYMIGEYLFQKLNEYEYYSVAGGVLLILIYLAIFGKKKQSKEIVKSDTNPDDGYIDYEEM